MKKKLVFSFLLLGLFNMLGQNYYMATPQGFGANTTGGGNATPVVVSTYTAFKNALQSTTPSNAVIIVSGTIDCTYLSVQLNNKTILGLPGARLRNNQITVGNSSTSAANSGILNIKTGSNNVIIRNLIFEGPGAYDVDGRDNLTNEGTNIWIDHCEFQDGMDGNFDIKGTGDNVTVSWCKFTYLKPAIAGGSGGSSDHRFSNLVGSSATDTPADGKYSVTFQNCFWATGCKDRMPRARNAELHLLSCYFNVNVSGSKAIGLGGGVNNSSCFVQNSHFANVGTVYSTATADGGTVAINFSNCLSGSSNIGTVVAPTYSTTPIPVNEVANYLTDASCGAGATLQITTSGTISPNNCAFLGYDQLKKAPFDLFYSSGNKALTILSNDKPANKLSLDIYSVLGKKVYSYSTNNLNSYSALELGINEIESGIYFSILNCDDAIWSYKFLKD